MVSSEKKTDRPYHPSLETLLVGATRTQRDEIERALTENAAGVERIATRCVADETIHRPLGCLLSNLRQRAHLAHTARSVGLNERKTIEIPWDGSLAVENAARARALISRLTGRPAPTLVDDDDIPGYGDAT